MFAVYPAFDDEIKKAVIRIRHILIPYRIWILGSVH